MTVSLAPLLAASPLIQVHAAAALGAAALAPVMFLRRKGDGPHRALGKLWVLLMAVTALSSFGIFTIVAGRPSPIHVLSVATLALLARAVMTARRGDIRRHRRGMQAIAIGALLLAGAFTLAPGRIMHAVVFGG